MKITLCGALVPQDGKGLEMLRLAARTRQSTVIVETVLSPAPLFQPPPPAARGPATFLVPFQEPSCGTALLRVAHSRPAMCYAQQVQSWTPGNVDHVARLRNRTQADPRGFLLRDHRLPSFSYFQFLSPRPPGAERSTCGRSSAPPQGRCAAHVAAVQHPSQGRCAAHVAGVRRPPPPRGGA